MCGVGVGVVVVVRECVRVCVHTSVQSSLHKHVLHKVHGTDCLNCLWCVL